MAARRDDAQPAAGAAVVVGHDDGAAKALVARFPGVAGLRVGQLQLLELAARLGEQFAAAQKGFLVRGIALPEQRLRWFVEVRIDQGGAQHVAVLLDGEQGEQVIVQPRAGDIVGQLALGDQPPARSHERLLAGQGDKLPEAFALHVKEGHGNVASHPRRQHGGTVEVEQVAQVGREFDQIVGDLALVELVEHGEEEQGFVGRFAAGGGGPAFGGVAAEPRENGDVVAQIRHKSIQRD